MSFFKNWRLVGFKDALFWDSITMEGGVLTEPRLMAHIRSLDRSLGRCLMLGLKPRYEALKARRSRLVTMLGKVQSRSPVPK